MVVVACCLESSGAVALSAVMRSSSERARVASCVPCHCVLGSVALSASPRPPSGDAWRSGCAVVWLLKVGHGVWCFPLVSAVGVVAVESCRACPGGVVLVLVVWVLSAIPRPPSGDARSSGVFPCRVVHGMAPPGASRPPSGDALSCGCAVPSAPRPPSGDALSCGALPSAPRPPSGDARRSVCVVIWLFEVRLGVLRIPLSSVSGVVAVGFCRDFPGGVALSAAARPSSERARVACCAFA